MKLYRILKMLIALLCFLVNLPIFAATNQEGVPQIQSSPNPAAPVPTEAHR